MPVLIIPIQSDCFIMMRGKNLNIIQNYHNQNCYYVGQSTQNMYFSCRTFLTNALIMQKHFLQYLIISYLTYRTFSYQWRQTTIRYTHRNIIIEENASRLEISVYNWWLKLLMQVPCQRTTLQRQIQKVPHQHTLWRTITMFQHLKLQKVVAYIYIHTLY